jgi:hypothetical protein
MSGGPGPYLQATAGLRGAGTFTALAGCETRVGALCEAWPPFLPGRRLDLARHVPFSRRSA